MSRFVNPFMQPRSGAAFAQAARVKNWARQALALDDKVVVSVNEVSCTKPHCPPQETVILALRAGCAAKLSIHRALADVIEADVFKAAREGEGFGFSADPAPGRVA